MFSPRSPPSGDPSADGFEFPVWEELFEPSAFSILPSDFDSASLPTPSQTSPEPVSSVEPTQTDEFSNSKTLASGSVVVEAVDERKRRRMASNRLSARRSRMRKQKHLENLRSLLNRLRFENRECTNRVRLVTYHSRIVRTENELLLSEAAALQHRLRTVNRVLIFRQLQQQLNPSAISSLTINNFSTMNNGSGGQFMKQHSLIT